VRLGFADQEARPLRLLVTVKTGRKRYAELIRRGVSAEAAAKTAGSRCGPWHVSQSPALDRVLSNAYLASLGLPSLVEGRDQEGVRHDVGSTLG
jgi:hypothetical protein